ncbi:MAG: hypothetical protein ACOX78_00265 [Lachnospiraceae bacterium]
MALLTLTAINSGLGYGGIPSIPALSLLLSAVCAFFPVYVTAVIGVVLIVLHIYGFSKLLAFSIVLLFLILYLLYFRFVPKDVVIPMVTMLCAYFRVPLIIPVFFAVTVSGLPLAGVPVGLFLFYTLNGIGSIEKAQTVQESMNAADLISYTYNMIVGNREMAVVIICAIVAMIVTVVIRNLVIPHAFSYSVVAGSVTEAVLLLILNMLLNAGIQLLPSLISIAAGTFAGEMAVLFQYNIDYTKSEHLRMEDSEYYYYVTAVPRRRQARKELKITHINARKIKNGADSPGEERKGNSSPSDKN